MDVPFVRTSGNRFTLQSRLHLCAALEQLALIRALGGAGLAGQEVLGQGDLARAQDTGVPERRQPVLVVDGLVVARREHVGEVHDGRILGQRDFVPL